MKNRKIYLAVCFLALSINLAFAKEAKQAQPAKAVAAPQQPEQKPVEYVGEFLDIKVPLENYVFIRSTYMVFGEQMGSAKTEEEKEKRIWDDLLLSYEAFRRGVTVSQEEIDEEVKKILEAEKATFDFKKDKQAYTDWLKNKTNEPIELFENQLRHLIQMRKLKAQVAEAINPQISDRDARQMFLDENSSLNVDLAEFEKKEDAESFCKKARSNKNFWDEEKNKRPKEFRQPGFVTLIFLIDMWKFPRDAAYKMLKMKKGEIYGPAPIYKGYGVFKVLDNRQAKESEYPKAKENYYAKLRGAKKYEGLEQWIKDLKQQANIKVYKK